MSSGAVISSDIGSFADASGVCCLFLDANPESTSLADVRDYLLKTSNCGHAPVFWALHLQLSVLRERLRCEWDPNGDGAPFDFAGKVTKGVRKFIGGALELADPCLNSLPIATEFNFLYPEYRAIGFLASLVLGWARAAGGGAAVPRVGFRRSGQC